MIDPPTAPASPGSIESATPARNGVMSDQWSMRMIQSCAALMIVSALFLLLRLSHQGHLGNSWLTISIVANLAVGILALALTFSNWFLRYWQPFSWIMAVMLTATDSLQGLAGHDPISLFIMLMLNMFGTGSLLPWSMGYQASFNLVCLGAWVVQLMVYPAPDQNEALRIVGLLTAASLGQFSCYLRIQFSRERAESESRIRESESALRQIFDANTDAITITDTATRRIQDVNAEFVRATGYSAADVIGKTPVELGLWADLATGVEFVRRIVDREPIHNMKVMLRDRKGNVHPSLVSAAVLKIRGKLSVLSSSRDITDLQQSQQRLEESEEKFRRIFESSLDMIVVTDLEHRTIVEANGQFLSRIGHTREDVVGHPYSDFAEWDDSAVRDAFVGELRHSGFVQNQEAMLRGFAALSIQALVSAATFQIGGHTYAVFVIRDVSKIKEAEQKLRSSEAMLREIFDSSLDNLTIVDLGDDTVVAANKEQIKTFGYALAEVVGKPYDMLDIWVNDQERIEFENSLRERGEMRNFRTVFRARDGRTFPVLISSVVLDLDRRKIALSIVRDITDLEDARVAALAASTAKSEFLSSMSHEIRTPMNAILGIADLLGESDLNPEQRRYLDTVVSNGNALLELINGILDLARVESGRLSLEAVEFETAELVDRVAETLAVRAHEKGVELVVRIGDEVGAVSIGDPLRLRQVLTNLIGNAIKFTEHGEIVVSVERNRDSSMPGNLLFSVRDTGIGIAPENLAAVFSSFSQADTSITRKYGGSGLGLAIVERLVALMGGKVWVESVPGAGSTFRFTADVPAAQNPALEIPPLAEPGVRGARVLIADDNASTREVLAAMMIAAGAQIVAPDSGASALDALEADSKAGASLALILIASRMTSIDSLALIRRAQSLYPGAAIVMMLSSRGITARIGELRAMKLNHFIAKPIRRRELYATIAEARHFPLRGKPEMQTSTPSLELPGPIERPFKLLLADDSPDNRMLINAYLRKTACIVDQDENGQLALDRFKSSSYDVVLLDIQMPVLDGYSTVVKMREWEVEHNLSRTPIIALTASALPEDVRRAHDAGFDLHVSKPVKKATLLASIASMLKTVASPDAPAPASATPATPAS